ncbi:HNH endonuclease [Acinetobacter baumannii]|uniref:HNH endonuclease n=1 Tax=Acinetobacter baumannii TaxID=470 RepID=UPI00234093A0|nr:HNH endonuclease [Acinetobacter baumannii]
MTVDNSACFSNLSKPMITCPICLVAFIPRQKNSVYCSRACHDKRPRAKRNRTFKLQYIRCANCKEIKGIEVKGGNHAKLCCSRKCGFEWQAHISSERSRLRAISLRPKKELMPIKVIKELIALKRIKARNKLIRLCLHCNQQVFEKYRRIHTRCLAAYSAEKKADYKSTDSYKNAKKANRVKRKAIQRGATIAEPINPLLILARDKWKCYLCGVKTPKELRGSYFDNAPELDHVIPLSKGGLHVESNLRCACRKCNAEKSDQIYQLI